MDANLAVLIDFENIAAGTEKEGLGRFDISAIMGRLVDKGRVLIARSYADWGRFSRFKQSLLSANVTMYELTSHGMQDKNRADIAMVVDALELAFTKAYVDTFVIVSGDSDFTPLVLKMRELDKRVIGIGTRSSTSRLLVQACDEFIFYDSIVRSARPRTVPVPRPGSKGPPRRQAAYDLLVDALHGLQRENPQAPLASVVKGAMRRKSPDFSESELGFPSFARFLESARDAGYVSLDRDPKAGGFRVDAVEPGEGDDDEPVDGEDRAAAEQWVDTFLPERAAPFVSALAEADLEVLSFPVRMQTLQVLEQVVAERAGKRRKVNVQFVREDVGKRLRKTFPDVPMRAIRGLLNALLAAGLLIHKDGTAVRSASASFHLDKNAEGLNKALTSLYLAHLEEANADLHDVDLLAELFLGDGARKREIEEALAWLAQAQAGQGDEDAFNDLDLDDLLVADETAEEPAPADPLDLEAALMPADEVPTAKASSAKAEGADKAAAEPAKKAAAKKAEPAKAKTSAAKAKTASAKAPAAKAEAAAAKAPAAEAAATEPPEAEADAEDAEAKPKRRRRVRRKREDEPVEGDGNDLDLDALLSD